MSFDPDELAPISALQHYLACPRQCALIHLEGLWVENRLTAEGRILHKKSDEGGEETRPGLRRVWGLPLLSRRLGLIGKADVVEFIRNPDGSKTPYPVEHKRGSAKLDDRDRVQLCAQAICLEEMLGVPVEQGALFYATPRKRQLVPISHELRVLTEQTAAAVHALLDEKRTPPAMPGAPCGGCSLADLCLPHNSSNQRVAAYFSKGLAEP